MGNVEYKVLPFDVLKAKDGHLCIIIEDKQYTNNTPLDVYTVDMVPAPVQETNLEVLVDTILIEDLQETNTVVELEENPVIVRNDIPETLYIGDDDITSKYKGIGVGICKELESGVLQITINNINYTFKDTGESYSHPVNCFIRLAEILKFTQSVTETFTRADGVTTAITEDYLNLLNEFSIKILTVILNKLDRDITVFSDNEINFYCQNAYLWAEKMMLIANTYKVLLSS